MNEHTKFDLLLYAAAEAYCHTWTEDILATPAEGGISPREYRRFRSILRRESTATFRWSPIKIAIVAVLVALSVGFTACVCIPRIRTAMKEVLVDWGLGYFSVDFQDTTDTSNGQETTAPPPETILQKAYIADLPEGYTEEVIFETRRTYAVQYKNGDHVFTLSQDVIGGTISISSHKRAIEYLYIGPYAALMVTDLTSSRIDLIWQDEQYRYSLSSDSCDKEALLDLAYQVSLR